MRINPQFLGSGRQSMPLKFTGYHRTEVKDSIYLGDYSVDSGPWQDVYVTNPQKKQLEEWIATEARIKQDYHVDPEEPDKLGQMKPEAAVSLDSKAKQDKKAQDTEALGKIQAFISDMLLVAQIEFEEEDERAARQTVMKPKVPKPLRLILRAPFLLKKPKWNTKKPTPMETIDEE